MIKIKKGDEVIVLVGKDKGRIGKVIAMMPKQGRAIVGGINLVKRHTRQSKTSEGGLVTKEAPIQVSNLAIVDPKDGKATRVGFRILDDGSKVRFSKRTGDLING